MQVVPISLAGRVVQLDPLRPADAPALWAVAEPALFAYNPGAPTEWTPEAFASYVADLGRRPACLPFAIRLRATGQPIGVTCYLDARPADRGLEIGGTWIARAQQGTQVNPECKYLLLRHAFATLGAVRVQLKTDGRNVQSQRAIARLGAVREGVLRQHMRMPDGYIRDTVMFSIVATEWPAVRAGLEARLGYVP